MYFQCDWVGLFSCNFLIDVEFDGLDIEKETESVIGENDLEDANLNANGKYFGLFLLVNYTNEKCVRNNFSMDGEKFIIKSNSFSFPYV